MVRIVKDIKKLKETTRTLNLSQQNSAQTALHRKEALRLQTKSTEIDIDADSEDDDNPPHQQLLNICLRKASMKKNKVHKSVESGNHDSEDDECVGDHSKESISILPHQIVSPIVTEV